MKHVVKRILFTLWILLNGRCSRLTSYVNICDFFLPCRVQFSVIINLSAFTRSVCFVDTLVKIYSLMIYVFEQLSTGE